MFEELDFVTEHTGNIVVSACPTLIESSAESDEFLWGYYLRIENNSDEKICLLGKNWNITDDKGNNFCDNSAGFKGELPELEPGEYFEFSSTAPLNSAHAVFYGSCKILSSIKKTVSEIKIPTFNLNVDDGVLSVLN